MSTIGHKVTSRCDSSVAASLRASSVVIHSSWLVVDVSWRALLSLGSLIADGWQQVLSDVSCNDSNEGILVVYGALWCFIFMLVYGGFYLSDAMCKRAVQVKL